MSQIPHVQELAVYLDGTPVGTLLNSREGVVHFAYDASWIANGFALSPLPAFALQLRPFHTAHNVLGGLHGVFNDALPDGWGLMLMDRELKRTANWDPHEIRALDRLSYMGDRAMGALEFKPVMGNAKDESSLSIAALAEAAIKLEKGETGQIIRALQLQGGSPGGARPKITIALSADGSQCQSGFRDTPSDFEHWLVKFRASATDPFNVGRIEMAYADMAKAAGVAMPETKLMTVDVGGQTQDYFAVRRFDRDGNQKRHVLSISGLLEISHRVPSLDYDALLQAISFATRDAREVEKAYRLMVFNVLSHNKDDHAKNFAILWNSSGWVMTPAYDLTFSTSLNNEHMTASNGRGNPTLDDMLIIAKRHSIKSSREIVFEVLTAIRHWPEHAARWKVDGQSINNYQRIMLALPCRQQCENEF
ncbi:MAG TPA: type II toxin-antitoxin system HipA family toxin [Arenimonas sp.]|nr:type II toxin-antitoxin system HipA family toxin [Arenimonas sp.]